MIRNIYCDTCGEKYPALHPEDAAIGYQDRRIEMPVKKPAEHFIKVGAKRQDLASLFCDGCGVPIADGQKALLVTMWRTAVEPEPDLWEKEYESK